VAKSVVVDRNSGLHVCCCGLNNLNNNIGVGDVVAGSDIQNVLVSLLNLGKVLDGKTHGGVVDFVSQNNVTGGGKSTVGTHGDVVLVGLFNSGFGNRVTSSPIVSVQVPDNSSQVQLGGNETNTIINTRKTFIEW